MPDDDPTPPLEELAAIGRYPRFSHAQERGLVAAAMEKPYWVMREGPDFVLYVERADQELIEAELVQFEEESRERKAQQQMVAPPLPKTDTLPLFLGAWIFSMYWMGQNLMPPEWVELGDSANRAIFAGEWWRTITALTLHGDLPHFIANLMFGLLFAAFLLPRFGGGIMWLGIVLSGGMGNWMNAYFYRREEHHTVGASTAVFGGLGMLVAWELLSRWRLPHTRSWWHLVVPFGGGLALLTYLGAGDETGQRVDYMAHLWGFVAGGGLGLLAGLYPLKGAGQRIAGWLAAALPVVAWALALRK